MSRQRDALIHNDVHVAHDVVGVGTDRDALGSPGCFWLPPRTGESTEAAIFMACTQGLGECGTDHENQIAET